MNYEWDTFVQGDVSCIVELAASVQTICSGVGKALRTYFLCQRDSRVDRTQQVNCGKLTAELGSEELEVRAANTEQASAETRSGEKAEKVQICQ